MIKTRDMVFIALFSALISVFSLVSIPMPSGIPITLQTFIIALSAYCLGSFKGSIAVLVYLAVGITGVPVFSGMRGGIAVIMGPTGGFLIGFIAFAYLCGIKTKKRALDILHGISAVLICHLIGTLWYSFQTGELITAFLTVSLPYLIKDFFSICIAVLISVKIKKTTEKLN